MSAALPASSPLVEAVPPLDVKTFASGGLRVLRVGSGSYPMVEMVATVQYSRYGNPDPRNCYQRHGPSFGPGPADCADRFGPRHHDRLCRTCCHRRRGSPLPPNPPSQRLTHSVSTDRDIRHSYWRRGPAAAKDPDGEVATLIAAVQQPGGETDSGADSEPPVTFNHERRSQSRMRLTDGILETTPDHTRCACVAQVSSARPGRSGR